MTRGGIIGPLFMLTILSMYVYLKINIAGTTKFHYNIIIIFLQNNFGNPAPYIKYLYLSGLVGTGEGCFQVPFMRPLEGFARRLGKAALVSF